jgi:hypothetical protein
MSAEIMKCTICEAETEYECEQCGDPTCENCLTPFTIHNQIDYCLCSCCHSGNDREKADYYQGIEAEEKEKERKKKEKSHKRWLWYHSPSQIEKRRLKRIELLKLRRKLAAERAERLASIMHNIFKDM